VRRLLLGYSSPFFSYFLQHEDFTTHTNSDYDSQRDEVLTKNIEEREQLKQELEQVGGLLSVGGVLLRESERDG
jgi:hypothetical protein